MNFVLFGLALIALADGLHRGVASGGRASWIGPALLSLTGVAAVLLGFKVDMDASGAPQSWHGLIHGVAYLLFVFSLLSSLFFLWRRLRGDPLWRGHGLFTLITRITMVTLFFIPWSPSFYFFLALMLA